MQPFKVHVSKWSKGQNYVTTQAKVYVSVMIHTLCVVHYFRLSNYDFKTERNVCILHFLSFFSESSSCDADQKS